ncbi:MAG: YcaO-like family protein [Candidatus Eremiobacteraeota bacterium]|nr:YcaO-like family protein [Candidatus Eremiobacteraeota bacterium]
MPALRGLYESLIQPRALTAEELPIGEFLRQQGALSLQPAEETPDLVFSANPPLQAGDYQLEGWHYRYAPGETACLKCLFRWWLERYHGPEWWDRIQSWPDFQLSWPPAEKSLELATVFPRADCACLSWTRWPRHWRSWTHPVSGPLSGVVERRRKGLWRVSLRLHEAAASGAHPVRRIARRAAVAEACERWAALQPCSLSRVRVRRLQGKGGRSCWSGLVYLGSVPDPHGQQLSHGLACGPSLQRALRAGFWELVERDALRRWWRDWRAGRPVPQLRRHGRHLWSLPGGVYLAFVGRDGQGAWGSAAGPGAARKALREARHNYQVLRRQSPALPQDCLTFADHSAWGWHHAVPRWAEMAGLEVSPPRKVGAYTTEGVYYYRFDCPWADRLGWQVVKVLSPRMRGLALGGEAPFHPFS